MSVNSSGIANKFAWLPTRVQTWRPSTTYAIVWLQRYYQQVGENKSGFNALGGENNPRSKWIHHLGVFSYEF